MENSIFDISVILCCYNSSSRLRPTLEYLSKQKLSSDIKWEILLIDNNSNDDTSEVAKQIWLEVGNDIPFQVILEMKLGLSNARKKGINCSKGEILIFCDDDNWFEENYLQYAFDIMKKDCNIGMLGGIGEEVLDIDKPMWFDQFKLAYAVGEQANQDGDITFQKGYVYGAGAIIRKSVLLEIYTKGFIHQLSDRIGTTLVSGGDNEIGYVIALSGYKIYYSSRLKFKHYLPESRISVSYLSRLVKGQQLTYYKIQCYEKYVMNRNFHFPNDRFYGSKKSAKKIVRLFLSLVGNKITYINFRLTLNHLLYGKLYQILYYNQFKMDIKNVERNIAFFKK